VERYGELLEIAGGKERMKTVVYSPGFNQDVGDKEEFIRLLHKRKTEIFMELISSGSIGLRPGVQRLIAEADAAGLKLGVCSTSNEKAVHNLLRSLLGDEVHNRFDVILAGDVVSRKKPDPEIYDLAAARLGLDPANCVVIEDSRNGLLAAKAAAMHCIVTTNAYTRNQDFSEADIVLDCLGDAGAELARLVSAKVDLGPIACLSIADIGKLFPSDPGTGAAGV
jgi:HAD superfamily hydrolase (TIGR01509 family)